MVRTTILLLALLLSLPLLCQEPMNLAQALEMAMKGNPELLQERARREQATGFKAAAFSAFLPTVDATLSDVVKKKVMEVEFPSLVPGEPPQRMKIDFTRKYQFTLQAVQPLFTGGRVLSAWKSAGEAEKIAKLMVQSKQDEIRARTKAAFYGVILARKSLDVVDRALQNAENVDRIVKERLKEGTIKRLDLLRAENRVDELKGERVRGEARIVEAENLLKTLLGMGIDQKVLLSGELPDSHPPLSREGLTRAFRQGNPLLETLSSRLRIGDLKVKQARASLFPTLSLVGQYNYQGDGMKDFSQWYNYYTISLNLSFTLFKGGSRLAEGRIAKAERDEVRSAVTALRDSLESELENCWKRWLPEKSRVEYTKAQHQRSQEEFRLAELSYREGMLTYTDLELSQVALAETELRYLQSLYEWATATYSLETLTGSEFPEHV